MATIGSLAVNIVASTDKFIAGLNKAQTGLGRFVSKISAAQTAVVGLGVYGFGRMVNQALEAGSALHDFSQKANISAEAVSALDYAAKQLGSSSASMHTALQRMNKAIGDAGRLTGKGVEPFSNLGFTFEEATNLQFIPAEQAFLKIVDALNKLPTAAQKASAAQEIFGKGAKDLMGVINAGTAEIVKMGDEAARTGAIIGSDQAAALDAAADAGTRFKDSWSSMWAQVVAVFAPVISVVFDALGIALRIVRATWLELQDSILAGVQLMIQAWMKMGEVANYILPQALEFDTASLQTYIDELDRVRSGINDKQSAAMGKGGGNPLEAPGSKEAVQQQKTTNQKLDQVVQAVQAGQGKVQLATAGVR